MAGTIVSDVVQNGAGASTSTTNVINGCAKAWVNFNGSGTPAIVGSYNVSSISRIGTGRFTVNLTNAMSDANYAIVTGNGGAGAGNSGGTAVIFSTQTTSSFGLNPYTTTVPDFDSTAVYAAIFR